MENIQVLKMYVVLIFHTKKLLLTEKAKKIVFLNLDGHRNDQFPIQLQLKNLKKNK